MRSNVLRRRKRRKNGQGPPALRPNGAGHGSADGQAASLRAQAPHLSERAKRLADRTRALVVTGRLSVVETTALLLETA